MKISNSKKQLAEIIHENGGWRDGYGFSAQDGDDCAVWFYEDAPVRGSDAWWTTSGLGHCGIEDAAKLPNWHQTILSREEYFHLYQAPDADGWIEWKGGECPVEKGTVVDVIWRNGTERAGVKALHIGGAGHRFWVADGMATDIIAYRLHKPEQAKPEYCESVTRSIPEPDEQVWENPPTIEQLAADYRNKLDYANRKQDEADKANMESDAALSQLEDAIAAIGFVITPLATTEKEPELVAAVKVGDEVECVESNIKRDKYNGMVGRLHFIDESDTSTPYLVDFGGKAKIWCHEVKFIRRP